MRRVTNRIISGLIVGGLAILIACAGGNGSHAEEKPEAKPGSKPTPAKASNSASQDWPLYSGDEKSTGVARSVLPDKLYMDGKSYALVDSITMGDRASEAAHSFLIEGAKQDWAANQSFKYPDGGKATARGRAHVGGTSTSTMHCTPKKLTPSPASRESATRIGAYRSPIPDGGRNPEKHTIPEGTQRVP